MSMDCDLSPICNLLAEVKANLRAVQQEWHETQALAAGAVPLQAVSEHDVIVPKASLEELATECEQMKNVLPRLVSSGVLTAAVRVGPLEEDLEQSKEERKLLKSEVQHWKTQLDNSVKQAQEEKQNQLGLRMDVQELSQQLEQQSEFASGLGATLGTLVWRFSRREETIDMVTSGPKSFELMELTSSCVGSYLVAYKDDQWPEQNTDEAKFILSLCGTITNIAASALGREFLATAPCGQKVIDTFLTFVSQAPAGKAANMKSLMLTSMYNLSINQKGLKYLCSRPGIISWLTCHLQEEKDAVCMANSLRLLQSLAADEDSPLIVLQLKENLPQAFLHELTTSTHKDVRQLALEVLMDLRQLDSEQ